MTGADPRRRRRAWIGALALLFGVAAGAALAAHERLALAERFLLWQLARRGVGDASLEVTRVGLRELALRELRIGDGDLTLGALELRFSPAGLAARRLDAARIEDLRLRGRVDAQGLRLGALDALRAGAAGSEPAPAPDLPLLPVGRLEVDRASLFLDTLHGPFEAMLSLELDAGGRGRFNGTTGPLATFDTPIGVSAAPFALAGDVVFATDRFEVLLEPAAFSLTLATGSGPQAITGTTPRVALRGGRGAAALEITGSDGELALLGPGVAAEGVDFEVQIDAGTRLPSGTLAVRRLRDRGANARFLPFAVETKLAPGDGKLGIEGVLRSEVPGVVARFEGTHDPATGSGRVGVRMEPLLLADQGPRPADLLPALAALVPRAAGEIEVRGELRWGEGGAKGSADLGLHDLTLETRAARLEGVNAAVHFEGPWPPRTPRGQLVAMARLDFGLELTNGLVDWALRRGGTIELEQAEWAFAGGTLHSSGRFDPFAATQALVMTVVDVDLAELLTLVNLEGLSGSGRLSGRLPLSLAGGSLRISEAELHASDEGGWIRYRPQGRAGEALGAAGAALDDFLLALRDFRYDTLSLRVDGDPQEEVKVAISLAGANPEHRDGQPYAFNLNVEGRLGDLVRKATAAYRIPTEIQQRLEAISRGDRK